MHEAEPNRLRHIAGQAPVWFICGYSGKPTSHISWGCSTGSEEVEKGKDRQVVQSDFDGLTV